MAKFVSKYRHYKLIIIPARRDYTNGYPRMMPGKSIVFKDGEYITTDTAELKFLREHDDFGKVMFETEDKTIEQEIEKTPEPPVVKEIKKAPIKRTAKKTVRRKVKVK